MPKVIVRGGRPLTGVVRSEPSKNAILPMLAGSLLASGPVVFREVPWLDDVDVLVRLLGRMGVRWQRAGASLTLVVDDGLRPEAPYYLVSRMRASFLVAGPLVARFHTARLPLPGGCAIGSRPVDLHLQGLEALGARVDRAGGEVKLHAERLKGADIYLDFPSVGATEQLLMAATLAEGTTRILNAAREPEVEDLARFLTALGARVEGAGTPEVRVTGVERLEGCEFTVIPDRIEAGTFLLAAAATGGDVTVENVRPDHLTALVAKLALAGCSLESRERSIRLRAKARPQPLDVTTMPYPGFPTDLQAPLMALLSLAQGTSTIRETIFENRFRHVGELRRLGARIRVEQQTAVVEGVAALTGAPVRATDLRAAAALVVAGLAAHGVTEVQDAFYLDRGYQNLERKLAFLGADIERVQDFVEVV